MKHSERKKSQLQQTPKINGFFFFLIVSISSNVINEIKILSTFHRKDIVEVIREHKNVNVSSHTLKAKNCVRYEHFTNG